MGPTKLSSLVLVMSLTACGGTSVEDPAGAPSGSGSGPGTGGSPNTGGAPAVPDEIAACPGAAPNAVAELTATSGSNGTFTDHCDSSGNLIAYECGTKSEWQCNEWECYSQPYPTDEVLEVKHDCAGTCQSGRCASKCPKTGDTIQYVGLNPDGSHRIDDKTQGFVYRCETLFDSCLLPDPGQLGNIDYYEAPGKTCMGTETAALGFNKVKSPSDVPCTFTCAAGTS